MTTSGRGQPDIANRVVKEAADAGIVILRNEHTHGGQCKPPFPPPSLLPVVNRRDIAGEVAGQQADVVHQPRYKRRISQA
jgi:hypothetical protein